MTRCGDSRCGVDHDAYRLHPNGQPWLAEPPDESPLVALLVLLIAATVVLLIGGVFLVALFVQ